MTTQQATAPVEPEAPKPRKKLSPAAISLAEHDRTKFAIKVDEGTVLQDVIKPTFWTHVAARLKVTDQIEVLCDDLTWYAELIVLHIEGPLVKVRPLLYVALTRSGEDKGKVNLMEVAEDQQDIEFKKPEFLIKFIPSKGHCVRRRGADQPWLWTDLPSKEAAQKKIAEYLKALRR